MKKLSLGIGLLGLTLGTLFSISRGANLKASDEPVPSESIQSSQSSVNTVSSSEEIRESAIIEPPATEQSNNPQQPETNQRQPEPSRAEEPLASSAQPVEGADLQNEVPSLVPSDSPESSTKQSSRPTDASSTTEPSSTTDSSTSTTHSESQSSSSSTSTTQSTSEQPQETTDSSKNSGGTGLTTIPSASEKPKEQPDETDKKEPPKADPTPETTPEPPVVSNEAPIADYPEQPSVPAYEPSIPTIGDSNPLGERDVELDEELEVRKVAESDFNGYELPLLSTFSDKNQGILIYEGLRKLGEKEANYTTETLINDLFKSLFDRAIDTLTTTDIKEKDLQPGDVIRRDTHVIGLYLGEDHYLTVKEKKTESEEETEDEQKEQDQKEPNETESEVEKDENTENTEGEKASEDDSDERKQEVVIARLSDEENQEVLTGQRFSDLTKTTYAEEIEQSYPASFAIESNEQTKKFIEQIGKDAQKLGLKYDVFASVMIAQAILESGSGTSGLSVAPNYNLFGVKGSYGGQSVSLPTQEDRGNGALYTISAAFRRYPSYAESLGDYVTLIRGGISGNDSYYQEAWRSEAKNYLRAANSLTGKYATDTSYHRKLSSIIAVYHLTQYDEKLPETTETPTGTTTSGIFLQGKDTIPEEYRKKMTLPDYDEKNYNTSGSYPVGQCTWYAFNRVAQLGGRVDDFMGNGGEWGAKGRRLGYEVTQTPKVGHVISFTPGTAGSDPRYGHVAIVEAITENGILISEGNVVGGTIISYRIIPNELAKSNLVSYIRPR